MGEWANPMWANVVSWIAAVIIIGLTLAYVGFLVKGL
jgi:Mn2+/Fe2+ NRAMP family transporter